MGVRVRVRVRGAVRVRGRISAGVGGGLRSRSALQRLSALCMEGQGVEASVTQQQRVFAGGESERVGGRKEGRGVEASAGG